VALWRVASGGTVPDEQLLRAARLALAGRDPNMALRLLGDATADGDGGDDGDEGPTRLDRAEVLVAAHSMRGAVGEAEQVVASVWDDDMDDGRRAELAKHLADIRFFRDRDLPAALAVYETARQRLTEPEALAAVDARRAGLLAGAGRPTDALRVLETMGTVTAPRTRVEVAGALATSLLSVGRFTEAREIAHRAGADHADLPDWLARRGIAQHLVNEAHALAYAGNYAEARELLEPAAERSRATSALGAWVWFEMSLAEIARDTGRAEEAIRRFGDVAEVAPTVGQHAALVWAHVGVAQGHLLFGNCVEAAAALERADAVGDSPVATSWATRERTRAWLDACRGDLASARQRIRETVGPIHHDGIYVFEAALLHDLARLGVPAEVVERLEELATFIDGPLAPIHAVHARAVVERDPEALREVVDRYEACDALALAAEAAAELADVHRGADEARLATAARQRSAELAARAGGLRTPMLSRGDGIEPLTAREREVALLAAQGRTSRAIGEHLGLSTRTVDTHLARVYRKLGIAGRAELVAALDA
jgi:DNA-binding CsgD family transcriptional regulator